MDLIILNIEFRLFSYINLFRLVMGMSRCQLFLCRSRMKVKRRVVMNMLIQLSFILSISANYKTLTTSTAKFTE